MHLLPIEWYLFLLLAIPLGLVFAKWACRMRWLAAAGICAVLSWGYFMLWMTRLDPPDMGFATAVYLVTGWLWMLPILALLGLLLHRIGRGLREERRIRIGTLGLCACTGFTAVVVGWNLHGRMSETRARMAAREELLASGYQPVGREIPSFERGHWIIRYPDSGFGEIRLTRNGRMSWIGGPG